MGFPFWNYSYIPVIILQIACILHALKTDRKDWIYLLIFLPFVGSVIYIIREWIPGLRGISLKNNGSGGRPLFGNRIKELERARRIADTDANRLALAAEYATAGQPNKAIELTQSCLKGIYANNAGMMFNLARYSFYAERYAESKSWFEKALAIRDARLEKPEDELLYARTLARAGDTGKAEEGFKRIIRVHHLLEARYYYGELLRAAGRAEEAKREFRAILEEKDLHPPHVRRANARWVRAARRGLRGG